MAKRLRLTLVRSPIGRLPRHRACVRGLGLRRLRHTVEVADTPQNRGMAQRVGYLLRMEEV